MADVQRWLTSECVSANTPEVQRLREAVNILTTKAPSKVPAEAASSSDSQQRCIACVVRKRRVVASQPSWDDRYTMIWMLMMTMMDGRTDERRDGRTDGRTYDG
jgi:hypothetical protein